MIAEMLPSSTIDIAGRAVAMKHSQYAALLLRERRIDERHSQQHPADCRE
jgi:hypothetical protein